MDLSLDYKKGRAFDCDGCDAGLQRLRNCSGNGPPAKNLLNQRIYTRCPRATLLENHEARFLVNIWSECREQKRYPYEQGGPAEQTHFTWEVFSFLDGMKNRAQEKSHDDHMKEMEKFRQKSNQKRSK